MASEKKHTNTGKRSLKSQNIFRLVLLLILLVVINVLSSFVFTRFDLTSEKRFTLSESTRELVSDLKDVVYVRVYLDGDFPPSFKRLQNATREMLDELRAYSNGNLEYQFINPSENPDQQERNKIYQQLVDKGIQPTNLQAKNKEETSEQIIFPGVLISYLGQEIPLMLLQDQLGASPEQMLNNSIQALEYGFANSIRKVTSKFPTTIAFLEGQGEAAEVRVADISRELKSFYQVERKRIDGKLNSLKSYEVVIIAAPDSLFDEKDKFILDQYVMQGGKILWLVDGAKVSMDSLEKTSETVAIANQINLDDMLFRYGARINYDLILDLQAAPIPVVTGYVGNRPQYSPMPWYYFPIVIPESKHPIVNNLNAVRFDFVSSIDPVGSADVIKTPLLVSSKYSRVFVTPARVTLDLMKEEPQLSQYNQSNKILALLLEGTFESNFKNRVPATILNDPEIAFKEKSEKTRMIVIGDGDVIKNGVRKSTNGIIPLGMDRYTGQVFGNKNFLLNCIDYLSDDSGLMAIRSKELKLRLLDKSRIDNDLLFWQLVNTAGPVLIIALFGLFKFYRRRLKYAS
ncbi:MAG: gliding motility-associated ABC transporter substrate-binding protein GldG [Bacteroidetes bacterium]|nr:gliding motility-associated ABC transporter substrate-binding protein GldG [Bacteroidota bacterium]